MIDDIKNCSFKWRVKEMSVKKIRLSFILLGG